jgi:hypothetical protein
MAMTNVELYEALKGSIPDKAARLIAEAFPAATDLATKHYVDQKFAELRADIHAEAKSAMRWMLGLFIPVWAATMGTLIVALTKL